MERPALGDGKALTRAFPDAPPRRSPGGSSPDLLDEASRADRGRVPRPLLIEQRVRRPVLIEQRVARPLLIGRRVPRPVLIEQRLPAPMSIE
ncbi:hypothetical protein HQQ82_02070 [Rathayibacter sp. VKM Ac-2856]|uniref:hypothetical protein n=1 Tax=Rathayibacter sp. VKM Ac-2856 TaxID=2739021 RepID=UPI0015644C7A|nr:hypothetical protein [Rathayibacter sp. VKM Ac-2856]NQX18750.1 hypothetical protein [Rathayibacter sp. VKM Ac-2856]